MNDERKARLFFGATAVLVTFGLILQFILTISRDSSLGAFESTPARMLNFFSFFTVQSNILVAVTTALLAQNLDRKSTVFRVLRSDAVICITVTGVVFHIALAGLQELTGWDKLADFVLHTLSPILCALGWLLFGPRRQITTRIVRLALIAPVCWLVYAFAYGAVVEDRNGNDYYAYPFMNVQVHGYVVALVRSALVAALFLGLSFAALAADRRLRGVQSPAAANTNA